MNAIKLFNHIQKYIWINFIFLHPKFSSLIKICQYRRFWNPLQFDFSWIILLFFNRNIINFQNIFLNLILIFLSDFIISDQYENNLYLNNIWSIFYLSIFRFCMYDSQVKRRFSMQFVLARWRNLYQFEWWTDSNNTKRI